MGDTNPSMHRGIYRIGDIIPYMFSNRRHYPLYVLKKKPKREHIPYFLRTYPLYPLYVLKKKPNRRHYPLHVLKKKPTYIDLYMDGIFSYVKDDLWGGYD